MNEKKMDQGVEQTITIKELQDWVKDLQAMVDLFLFPLSIRVYNETFNHPIPTVPPVMGFIAGKFHSESDNERKRFLKALYDKLRETLPMELSSVSSLPEVVEEEVDLGIFER